MDPAPVTPPTELSHPYRAKLREKELRAAELDASRLAGDDVDEQELKRTEAAVEKLRKRIAEIEHGE